MIIWGRTQDWYTWPKAEIGWRPRGQMGSNLPMDDDSLILFVSSVLFIFLIRLSEAKTPDTLDEKLSL